MRGLIVVAMAMLLAGCAPCPFGEPVGPTPKTRTECEAACAAKGVPMDWFSYDITDGRDSYTCECSSPL